MSNRTIVKSKIVEVREEKNARPEEAGGTWRGGWIQIWYRREKALGSRMRSPKRQKVEGPGGFGGRGECGGTSSVY